MVVDATVPLLVTLVLLVAAVATAAAVSRWCAHHPRAQRQTPRARRSALAARAALRCPRVVLLDETGWHAATGVSPVA